MLYALAGIVIGFAAGWYFPLYLPFEYARLLSVSLMAALDTVFGGMRSSMEGKYDNSVSAVFTIELIYPRSLQKPISFTQVKVHGKSQLKDFIPRCMSFSHKNLIAKSFV